jgi:glycerol-3-phosphate acyltransferase PlsX
VEILLVGEKEAIDKVVAECDTKGLSVKVIEATQKIVDGEEPAFAVMRKPNSSVALAARLVKQGEADAVISAGSTGAMMVSALQYIGTLRVSYGRCRRGVPSAFAEDGGARPRANVGSSRTSLSIWRCWFGVCENDSRIENPKVGLLNVGAEEGKGNDQVKEAFGLLKNSGVNFIGNVEGMDIPFGRANVIVCDGFVGNILVKYSEGLGRTIQAWLNRELAGKVDDETAKGIAGKLYRLLSPGEVMGGGPLWGVDGVAAIAHGASKAAQIVGTVKQVIQAIEPGAVETLRKELT